MRRILRLHLILSVLLILSPELAFAFKADVHAAITKEALHSTAISAGGAQYWFSECVIKDIIDANLSVDGGKLNYPYGNFWQSEMHFDGEQFRSASQRLINLKADIVNKLNVTLDGRGAQDELGSALHTVQDFYAHTNWVELGNGAIDPDLGWALIPDPDPTVYNCDPNDPGIYNPAVKSLTSGYFQLGFCSAPTGKCRHGYDLTCPLVSCCPDGLNKDDATRAGYPIARSLAVQASKDFIQQILSAPGVAGNVRAIELLTRGRKCASDHIYEAQIHSVSSSNRGGLSRKFPARAIRASEGNTAYGWILYPGACAGGAPSGAAVADSLDSYATGSTGPYSAMDNTTGIGVGSLWQVVDGEFAPTADVCALEKNAISNHLFFGVDASTKQTIPGQFNSIVTCALPVPAGTTLFAEWSEYLDLPQSSGFVQYVEYRFYRDRVWSDWRGVLPDDAAALGGIKGWTTDGGELVDAARADSVQLSYNLRCVPDLAADGQNCESVNYGVLYDDLCLVALSGQVGPGIDFFGGSLAQTTFVDGSMTGANCATTPCWPGIRGTDLQSDPDPIVAASAIGDNFNSPLGDSLTIMLSSGLRQNGLGINWEQGFDKYASPNGSPEYTNRAFIAAFDKPRMIYRLFDPATRTWSPFDSTGLDADAITISGADTVVTDNEYRVDWPPRDKIGLNLPGGFTINGVGEYSRIAFLPRGTRMQYYFKAVDINGGISYRFSGDGLPGEVQDLPMLPMSSIQAPDIMEFDVLPGTYAPGHPGTLLAGVTNAQILNLDGAYTSWSFQQDPVTQALRGMGVRADRYRLLQGIGEGSNFGGHELVGPPDGQRARHFYNYFPNMTEYAIRESLSAWYRILIQSSHLRTATLDDESDARLIEEWWDSPTPGWDGGDRCVFTSGDDYFNSIMNTDPGDPAPRRHSMGNDVFGINSVNGSWSGTASVLYPTVTDNFSGQTYPVDGGCPGPNRFDALIKQGTSDAQNVAFYPTFAGVTDVAGVATMSEKDAVTDNDRSKALGYGFSIQFVRKAGIPTSAANYVHSGVAERMQILYKFLASCRGPRSGSPADTGKCWPCPTDANLTGNWAALSGFQTGTYGPLHPIQDPLAATGVREEPSTVTPPYINTLAQNRPNPFNPRTLIRYSLADAGQVQVRIFDVAGRLVRTLVDAKQGAGWHEVPWDGRNNQGTQTASGMYFYRITYPDGATSAKKMAILR